MIIKNCRIFNGLEFLEGLHDIVIKNNKIIAIGNNLKNIKNQEIVDIDGNFAVPGYIDIHTHGINGIDFQHQIIIVQMNYLISISRKEQQVSI